MANLVVDIGNTALKAAYADGMTLGKTFRYQGEMYVDFILSLAERQRPEIIVVSTARELSEKERMLLGKGCSRLIVIDPAHMTDMSIRLFQSKTERLRKYDFNRCIASPAPQSVFLLTGRNKR